MQQLLYAADFSERDRHSFHQACRLARAWRAKLLIAHVDNAARKKDGYEEDDEIHAPRMSPKLFDIFPTDLEIDYDHILRNGDPAKVILGIEDEYDVDLIVLGTHGRKGIERIFAGSVAEKVIRLAKCPVLTLRQVADKKTEKYHIDKAKILVPTDFSVHSYAALDFASSLANSIDGGLTILHVDEAINIPINQIRLNDAERRERLNELWLRLKNTKPNEAHLDYGHKLLVGSPPQQIVKLADELEYDYIVLGTHGRTGIGRALIGSVAEEVVRRANCAVISVKSSDKRSPAIHYQR